MAKIVKALLLHTYMLHSVFIFAVGEITEEIECDCGPYSQNRERNGICSCSCLPGYKGAPPNCRLMLQLYTALITVNINF